MKRRLTAALLTPILTGMGVFAQNEFQFTYVNGDLETWGTSKLENYDAAIRVADPTLTGNRIREITVDLPATEGLSDFRIWITSELKLEGKENAPDILLQDVEPAEGSVTLSLEEPVTIPAEGLYVGYSFIVDQLTDATRKPVYVSASENPDSFYIHTSRTYRSWVNLNKGVALAMTLGIEGDFSDNAVAIRGINEPGILHGNPTEGRLTLRNHGLNTVSELTYQVTVNGTRQEERTVTFNPSLPANYDTDIPFDIALPAMEEAGTYPLTIDILKVNGENNEDPERSVAGNYYVYPYLPDHYPLMEEFTATWCGWCPKGAVSMEGMEEMLGEKFVGVSYHREDVMAIPVEMPVKDAGAPNSAFDRGPVMDPYFGTWPREDNSWQKGILKDWEACAAKTALADLNGSADWKEEGSDIISVTSTASFIRPFTDVDFRFLYILAENRMHGPVEDAAWLQKNYYSGMEEYAEGGLKEWYEAPRNVGGLDYNFVVVMTPAVFGTEGSLPSDIPYLEELSYTQELDINDARNIDGEPLVQARNNLYMVVAVVDARSGEILNSRKVPVGKNSGVETPTSKEVTGVEYYNLQGMKVAVEKQTSHGPLIRLERHADGRVTAGKICL